MTNLVAASCVPGKPGGAKPRRRERRGGLLAAGFLCGLLLQTLPGCGAEPPVPEGALSPGDEDPSCEGLETRDPKTGGNLSCLACRHAWRWRVPAGNGSLRFLIDLTCESTPGAWLTLTAPDRRVLWRRPVRPGDTERFCVPVREPGAGTYTVTLSGDLPLGLTHFTGSIWMNLFDRAGSVLPPQLRTGLGKTGEPP